MNHNDISIGRRNHGLLHRVKNPTAAERRPHAARVAGLRPNAHSAWRLADLLFAKGETAHLTAED